MREKLETLGKNHRFILVCVIATLVLGVVLRFFAMMRGYNYDFESYEIIGNIADSLGNVYAETIRYNYGPIWLTILGILHFVSTIFGTHQEIVYRVMIVSLLTCVDIAIALILRKKFGNIAFIVFFLNPISIIITGFHNQFDNLAIFIGLLGLLVMPEPGAAKVQKGHVRAALLIGLSLMTKHIFFILPIWLFIREKKLKVKLFMLILPLAMFGLSFVPFVFTGFDGIVHNVFLYKSYANAPLLHSIFSLGFVELISPMLFFVGALIVTGFLTRRLPMLEAGLWYLLVLVAFSPAIANQYLAIPMSSISALGVVFFIPYILLSTLLLSITNMNGMHIQRFADNVPDKLLGYVDTTTNSGEYKLIIFTLLVGLILLAIYRYRRHWFSLAFARTWEVIEEQLLSFQAYQHWRHPVRRKKTVRSRSARQK